MTSLNPNVFKSELKPIWCPGCGDFGVVQALYRALSSIGRPPHEVAFISGIGCSSRIPGYTTAYGFNTVHGRALPIAQGIKLANPDLLVLVAGGDGDGFSIGGGHVPHAIRRNLDITYLVMDNQVYGLTKGQLSPTSPKGLQTVTSAYGSLEQPINPLLAVLSAGAGFVAQGTPADMPGLVTMVGSTTARRRRRTREGGPTRTGCAMFRRRMARPSRSLAAPHRCRVGPARAPRGDASRGQGPGRP